MRGMSNFSKKHRGPMALGRFRRDQREEATVATMTPRQCLLRAAPATLIVIGFDVAVLFGASAFAGPAAAQRAGDEDDEAAGHTQDITDIWAITRGGQFALE